MTSLDLNKFPCFEDVHGLLQYEPFKEFPSLENLEDVSERIFGCAQFIGAKPDKNYPFWSENASLRAYLGEFSSLNEVLKTSNIHSLRSIAIEKVDYPLFHFLKLLRNINFHVKSTTGSETSNQMTLYNKETKERWGEEMTITRYIIADCDYDLLANSRDIKYYSKDDILAIIDWININQNTQGIWSVLEETLRQYCILINSMVANTA